MTLDTLLRTQLTSAVEDTTVPPGLARAALAGGRRRRRRRRAGRAVALATAAVVGGALLAPGRRPARAERPAGRRRRHRHEQGRPRLGAVAAAGSGPGVPFFADGGLWADGQLYALPASVNHAYPPRTVDGWLARAGRGRTRSDLGLAVLSPDGRCATCRPRPTSRDSATRGSRCRPTAAGSPTERGSWTSTTMQATPAAAPAGVRTEGGYITRSGRSASPTQGLVYEGAPFDAGLRHAPSCCATDGSTVARSTRPTQPHRRRLARRRRRRLRLRRRRHRHVRHVVRLRRRAVGRGRARLHGAAPSARHSSISPDGRWLITDDLPRVWDLQEGEWRGVDMPRERRHVAQMDAHVGGVVWETADSFLLPVADRMVQGMSRPSPTSTSTSRSCAARCRPVRASAPATSRTCRSPRRCGARTELAFAQP